MIIGNQGNDSLYGGADDDVIVGGTGNDELHGEDGRDILNAGVGDDILIAGNGRDILLGGEGNDSLYGGLASDLLEAGDGNDILAGGEGADVLRGGLGSDIFIYKNISESRVGTRDVISDFDINADKIDLSNLGAIYSDLEIVVGDGATDIFISDTDFAIRLRGEYENLGEDNFNF